MSKRGIEFAISVFDRYSAPLENFNAKMAQSTAGLRRLGASLSGVGRSSGLAGVGKSFGEVSDKGMALGSKMALLGGGIGFGFKKGFLDVASQFEDFEIILTNLNRGDAGKSKKEMGWISDFAAKTPYELAEVTDSFVKLRSYGLEPMNGLLTTLGDTSKSMGKPLAAAVEAMADAVTGENERLKEFGVTANKVGQKIIYNYTDSAGKQAKMMVKAGDRAAIQATLMKIWGEKFAGGMEAGSKGWKGMMSNLSDTWSRFAMKVMSGSAFDWMKGKLQGFLSMVEKMDKDGSLDALAKQWGQNITTGLKNAWEAGKGVASALAAIGAALSVAATAVGGWDNLARIAVGFMASSFILSVVQLTGAIATLGVAMTATPLGMFAAAIGLITLNFVSASDVITGLCQTVSLLTVAWGVMSAVFYASPIGLLVAGLGLVVFAIQKAYEHWNQLMDAFKGVVPDWVLRLLGVSTGSASGREGATPGGMKDFGKAYTSFGGASPGDTPRGITSGDVVPYQRPSLGAAQLSRRIQENRFTSLERNESKVSVDFTNIPRGAAVTQSGAPVDMDLRWDMGLAMPDAR